MEMKYNDLSKIPDHDYEGYIWGSEHQYPQVLKGEKFIAPLDSLYIVEALLYCKAENISILIKHTGQTQIYQYNLSKFPKHIKQRSVSYLSHRLGDHIKRVNFQQIWIPESDPNCESWDVLKMRALIFTGFNQQKNN